MLEDNARTPSGVSYMLENRETMLQMFPELFSRIQRCSRCRITRATCAGRLPPRRRAIVRTNCTVAVLTPGIHNSAYFEHAFLADQMGVELVEGHDIRITGGKVQMRTTPGLQTDRRALPPGRRRFPRSAELPPRQHAGRAGHHGCLPRGRHHHRQRARHRHRRRQGDLQAYMPDIVEFYTRREGDLAKTLPTWRCLDPDSLAYVLDNPQRPWW